MDREVLEGWLAAGLSLEQMGERAKRHPSTISYWLTRYGLRANGARRHAPRGAMDEAELRRLVDAGHSIREIAARLDRSPTTIRHWLTKLGLQTRDARSREATRVAKAAGRRTIDRGHPVA